MLIDTNPVSLTMEKLTMHVAHNCEVYALIRFVIRLQYLEKMLKMLIRFVIRLQYLEKMLKMF